MEPGETRSGEREVVASFATHGEAQDAIQLLADRKIDAELVTVTREATSMAGKSVRASRVPLAIVGAVVVGLFGAVLGIALNASWMMFAGVALGAILGAAIPPSSATERTPEQIGIERHDVVTQRDLAIEARRVLDLGGFRVNRGM